MRARAQLKILLRECRVSWKQPTPHVSVSAWKPQSRTFDSDEEAESFAVGLRRGGAKNVKVEKPSEADQ